MVWFVGCFILMYRNIYKQAIFQKSKWNEVADDGRKKAKCVGNGNVKKWKRLKDEDDYNQVRLGFKF